MAKEFGQYSVKYRPKKTKSVVGNAAAKREVDNILRKRDVHAILMYGPSGCGKTTLAKILALGLAGDMAQNVVEKNIGDENGINDIRSLITQSRYLPQGQNTSKVFILDEVHSLRGPAQSAILKTIEEPEHDKVVWILCTDRPQMLEGPLLNRLYKIGVTKPTEDELVDLLFSIATREKIFDFPDNKVERICEEIAKASDRVPREALQLLKQIENNQSEYKDFKELVIQGIRRGAEQSLDKTAIQILMAIYSQEKDANFRREFIVNQMADKDAWALTMRLTDIHHSLLNTVAGIKGGPGYYYHKELSQHKAVPDLKRGFQVAAQLVTIRNTLPTVNTKLEHYVVAALVNLVED